MKTELRFLFLLAAVTLLTNATVPAFAFVEDIQANKKYYVDDEKIILSGSLEKGTTGLVTVVINDPENEFVLLKQAFPKVDDTFEIIVDTDAKFLSEGTYNATAFVVNMTEGASVIFDYYFNENNVPTKLTQGEKNEDVSETIEVEETQESQITVYEDPNVADTKTETILFPDPEVDPQYYIDRYENEPLYREWFERNFPDKTIFEVVGIEEPIAEDVQLIDAENIDEEILVDSQIEQEESTEIIVTESSFLPDNSEISQMFFALGGLGVLFGAVYGIKKRVDSNSEQIHKNKIRIDRKISDNNTALDILQNRLANGEISIRQYKKLRKTLE